MGYAVKSILLRGMDKKLFTKQQIALRNLLRQIRSEAGLRQVDVAERLGEPQSFVSKFESGERRLDLIEVREVCRAVGVSLTDFVKRFEESLP
jgi:transcriptional regulator with XRE-family HTH domain